MDYPWSQKINRRTFLRQVSSGSIVLATGCGQTSMNIFGPSLDELLAEGKIKVPDSWPTDNIIPLPKDKILIGTNVQPLNSDITRWRKEGATQMMYLNDFRRDVGIMPALSPYGPGRYAFYNDFFFDEKHDTLNKAGVIPVVRYVTRPFNGFKEIAKGKHDETFKILATDIAENRVPYVMIPYQFVNEHNSFHYEHGAGSPKWYKETYARMHDIFKKEGANANTIWSVKLHLGNWGRFRYRDPFSYIPPSEYVDWLGWSVNNISVPEVGIDYYSFEQLMGNIHDKAAVLYPDKPQFIWELGEKKTRRQHTWIDDALTTIPKNYPWIKGVVFDVMAFISNKDGRFNFFPELTEASKEVVKKHMASGKYAGAYTDGTITIQNHITQGNKWRF